MVSNGGQRLRCQDTVESHQCSPGQSWKAPRRRRCSGWAEPQGEAGDGDWENSPWRQLRWLSVTPSPWLIPDPDTERMSPLFTAAQCQAPAGRGKAHQGLASLCHMIATGPTSAWGVAILDQSGLTPWAGRGSQEG
jgi:hypothetical protein